MFNSKYMIPTPVTKNQVSKWSHRPSHLANIAGSNVTELHIIAN